MGGNFDLRFSRCSHSLSEPASRRDLFNPHDDAEPFLRNILRHGHGRLAPSLHRLVTILRETLPIVSVLEEIRQKSKAEGRSVDVFAKAAGWYRLLFGDLRYVPRSMLRPIFYYRSQPLVRHALDFRLMSDQRVAILDASYSPFASNTPAMTAKPVLEELAEDMGLQPIPQFMDILTKAIQTVMSSGELQPGRIAIIDVGAVCDTLAVPVLGREVYSKITIEQDTR
jgi:mediator of RNA polymerase II transcription subunit 14